MPLSRYLMALLAAAHLRRGAPRRDLVVLPAARLRPGLRDGHLLDLTCER